MDPRTKEIYADLVEQGGLAPALRAAFVRIGSTMRVVELDHGIRMGFFYVTVKAGDRSSQTFVAAEERLFLFDCWSRGVMLATGATPDLERAALAIDRWVGSTRATEEMAAAFDFIKVAKDARAYERGVEVEERWRRYLETVPESIPELAAVVREASARPELRRLFPFTSLNALCFSRCTGYPFTRDVPSVLPSGRDGYRVVLDSWKHELGRGDAREAADLVVAHLPPGCAVAVPGTADDLERASREAERRPGDSTRGDNYNAGRLKPPGGSDDRRDPGRGA